MAYNFVVLAFLHLSVEKNMFLNSALESDLITADE